MVGYATFCDIATSTSDVGSLDEPPSQKECLNNDSGCLFLSGNWQVERSAEDVDEEGEHHEDLDALFAARRDAGDARFVAVGIGADADRPADFEPPHGAFPDIALADAGGAKSMVRSSSANFTAVGQRPGDFLRRPLRRGKLPPAPEEVLSL